MSIIGMVMLLDLMRWFADRIRISLFRRHKDNLERAHSRDVRRRRRWLLEG